MAMKFIFLIFFYIINTSVQILLGGASFTTENTCSYMLVLINWVKKAVRELIFIKITSSKLT